MMRKLFLYGFISVLIIGCTTTKPIQWISTPRYNVEYNLAWSLTTTFISELFDIETAEKASGYIRTEWKPIYFSEEYGNLSDEIDKVGVRFTCHVEKRCPFQLKLKVERGLLRSGEWIPIWVDYSREAICQRCNASREWIDEELEREILKELSVRLNN